VKAVKVPANFLLLRLYVAGNSPNSLKATANIEAICKEHYPNKYKIEIIDTLNDQSQAFEQGVLVTPTLVKNTPLPKCQIIGDLSDKSKVLFALGGLCK
jgi:circadian clock protein KaiB